MCMKLVCHFASDFVLIPVLATWCYSYLFNNFYIKGFLVHKTFNTCICIVKFYEKIIFQPKKPVQTNNLSW